MKIYNSIDNKIIYNTFLVFDKLDGSNIRAEWNKKQGFYKFGSRKRLIDSSEPILGESIELIQEKYSKELSNIFKSKKYESATCYFEFFGENSFAGSHVDEKHDVVLFDIDVYKKGILDPIDFVYYYNHLGTPRLLYYDKITDEFVQSVKNGTIEGMTFEGVVCKRKYKNQIQMFKIKNKHWIEKLKTKCGNNQNLFNELA